MHVADAKCGKACVSESPMDLVFCLIDRVVRLLLLLLREKTLTTHFWWKLGVNLVNTSV